jgi:hypothetical protein
MNTSVSLTLAIGFAVLISGCNTLLEVASPSDTSTGYRQTKNSKGQTVYRRERYVAPAYAEPEPTPIPDPVYLPVYADEPVQDNHLVETRAEPIQLSDSHRYSAPAAQPSVDNNWALGTEVSSDGKRTHLALEVFRRFDWLELKIGGSLFRADTDLYAGFDVGLRPTLQIVDHVSLFGGAGLYGGDTKSCSYSPSGIEECEKKFLYAGYVEAGVYLWNLSLFARSYNIEEAGKAIPSDTFYGVGLRTTY